MFRCVLDYEKKYQESVSEAKLFMLQQCIHNARKQVKVAVDRRLEVLNSIRRTPQQAGDTRPFPRETFGSALVSMQGTPILQEGLKAEYKLTRDEVDAWMNSRKKKFLLVAGTGGYCRADKLAGCQSIQRHQRQHSRFLGMLKSGFGGKKNLQQFLENEKFVRRMLQPVELRADTKPLFKRSTK